MPLDTIALQNPLEESFGIDPLQEGLKKSDNLTDRPANQGYEENPSTLDDWGDDTEVNSTVSANFLDDNLESLQNNNPASDEDDSTDRAEEHDPITGENVEDDINAIADDAEADPLINPGDNSELETDDDAEVFEDMATVASDSNATDLETDESAETDEANEESEETNLSDEIGETDESEPLESSETDSDNEEIAEDIAEEVAAVSDLDATESATEEDAEPSTTEPMFESGIFTVDSSGEVSIDYLFDGGGYKGQVAIFSLEGLADFEPGSAEFIQEVTRRALSGSQEGHIAISDRTEGAKFTGDLGEANQNYGTYLGGQTFAMRPGDTFGIMLVPNGTVEEVFDNPEIGGAKRPLFSMVTANPNEAFHVGQIADVTGDGNTFVLEDLRVDTGSDRDYNDMIFQIRGATGKAVDLDEVINPNKDWRDSELGQELIDYVTDNISDNSDNSDTDDSTSDLTDNSDADDSDADDSIDNSDTDDSDADDSTSHVTDDSDMGNSDTDDSDMDDSTSDLTDDSDTDNSDTDNSDTDDSTSDLTDNSDSDNSDSDDSDTDDSTSDLTDNSDSDNSDTDDSNMDNSDTDDSDTGDSTSDLTDNSDTDNSDTDDSNMDNSDTDDSDTDDSTNNSTNNSDTDDSTNNSDTDDSTNNSTNNSDTDDSTDDSDTDDSTDDSDTDDSTDDSDTDELTPEAEATVADVTEEINDELVPELEEVLNELKTELADITANPDSALENPPADAPTEAEQDELIADWNAELEEAFAELTEDEFADVNALAGKFEFAQEDQPLVGVIDTGFAANNPDIDESRIISGQDYIDNDDNSLLAEGEGDDHGTKVLEVIAATQNNNVGIDGVNDDAPIWLGRAVGGDGGDWTKSLVDFVDAAKESAQPNAVVNLSFDLSQENADGSVTTRTEFTEAEIEALKYARDNNVLVVVAAGNQGEAVMSALGQASEDFDNVITVGAADEDANRADYSSYGKGLDLLAYGYRLDDPTTATGNEELDLFAGLTAEEVELVEKLMQQSDDSSETSSSDDSGDTSSDDISSNNSPTLSEEEEAKAFAATQKMLEKVLASLGDVGGEGQTEVGVNATLGTSMAAAKVTGAASQVWAANPDLNFAQVKEILKATAVDLHTPGWDAETGAGLLNLGLAVQAALTTQGETYAADNAEILSDLGVVDGSATPGERPAGFFSKLWSGVKKVFKKVVKVVKKVVTIVKKVVSVVKKVVSFVKKALPILKKIGSFIGAVAKKFLCLPILGKVGIVLGGIALVGAAIGGAILWFKNKKKQAQQQQQQTVVVQQDPQEILDLETAWKGLSPAQQNDIGPALKNGIDPKYQPLLDGTDPDGIIPLLNTVGSLTTQQQQQLGPYIANGVPGVMTSFFDGSDPANSFVPATVKNAWNSLTPAQQNELQPVMINGITSPYGRPLLTGDPDGIGKVLSVLGSTALNDSQRTLMANIMLTPGGIPPEYENRFQ